MSWLGRLPSRGQRAASVIRSAPASSFVITPNLFAMSMYNKRMLRHVNQNASSQQPPAPLPPSSLPIPTAPAPSAPSGGSGSGSPAPAPTPYLPPPDPVAPPYVPPDPVALPADPVVSDPASQPTVVDPVTQSVPDQAAPVQNSIFGISSRAVLTEVTIGVAFLLAGYALFGHAKR